MGARCNLFGGDLFLAHRNFWTIRKVLPLDAAW
jgi:hypothetical protein